MAETCTVSSRRRGEMSVNLRPPSDSTLRPAPAGQSTTAGIRISLLNRFELSFDGRHVLVPFSVERLMAFLALHDGSLLRPYVAGVLWPETTETRAGANLRSSLWRIRRTGYPVVFATGNSLRLGAEVSVDVRDLLATIRLVFESSRNPSVSSLQQLLNARELLPGWYEDWVLLERERVRQLRLHALEALCERLTARGRLGAAVETGLAAVAAEPLRESAHRVLIRAYLVEGNQGEAIRQYHKYCRLVHEELRLKPSPQMQDLVAGLGLR
jgi:DNA-binding SARP family transcriptional activator